MSMIGDCWNCGEKFRFNEAKIKHMALITCPNCKERVLIEASVKDGKIDYNFNPPPLLNKKRKERPLKAPGEEGISYSPEKAKKLESQLSVDLDETLGTSGNAELRQRLNQPVPTKTMTDALAVSPESSSGNQTPEWERRGGGEGVRSRLVDESLRKKPEAPKPHRPSLTPQKAGMTPRRKADPFTGESHQAARRPIPQPAPQDSGYLDFDLPQAATISKSKPRAEDSTEAHNLELRHAEADFSGEEEIRSLTDQAKRESVQSSDASQTQPPLSGARPVPPKRLDPVMSSRSRRATKDLTTAPSTPAVPVAPAPAPTPGLDPNEASSSLAFSEPAFPSEDHTPGVVEPPMGGLTPSTMEKPRPSTQAMTTPGSTPQVPMSPEENADAEQSGEIMRDLLSEQMYAMQDSATMRDEAAPTKRGERFQALQETVAMSTPPIEPQPPLDSSSAIAPPLTPNTPQVPRLEPVQALQAARLPRAVAPLERDTRTTIRAKGSVLSLVGTLAFVAVAIVVAVVLVTMNPEDSGSSAEDPQLTENQNDHLGKFFVDELIKDAGLVATDGAQLMNEAELEFAKDNTPSYQKAKTLFHQALAKQPDNPLAIAFTVETAFLLPDRSTKIEDIKRSLNMLDYALLLKGSNQAKAAILRTKARIYLSIDNLPKALTMAEEAKELSPTDLYNTSALAEIQLQQTPEQSIRLLEPLLNELHFPLRALRLLHEAYQKTGRLKKAESVALKREEIDPDSCALCSDMGHLYLDLDAPDKAAAQFDLLQRKKPTDPDGYVGKALSQYVENPDKLNEVQQALSNVPDGILKDMNKQAHAELSSWQARFHLQAGQDSEAIYDADNALKLNPLKPEAVYLKILAEIWKAKGQPAQAEDWLRLLNEIRLKDPNAYQIPLLAGYVNQKSGDLKEALRQYEIAHQKAPRATMPLLLLADLSMESGIVSSAEEYLSKLLKLGPNHRESYERISLYLERFDFSKLVERLSRIDNHRMDIDRKWTLVGLTNYLAGNRNAAMMNFQKVLYNNRRHHQALLFQAAISAKQGKSREVVRLLETLLKRYPEDVQARVMLARHQRKNKQSEGAYKILNEAERLNLVDGELSSELALAAQERGDTNRAESKAAEAWRLDPNNLKVLASLYELGI